MLFLDRTPDLTPIDLDIYKYVVNHLEQVSYMRIRDLAKETHTSTTSILRFCQKFECEGFSEFRIKLQLFLKDKKTAVTPVDETAFIDFIKRTTQEAYQEQIMRAVEVLKDKELVLFIGEGASNVVAAYGALYFSSLFTLALRIEDPENYPVDFLAERLSDKICIIALSVSGETPEIIEYLNHVNFGKSASISITNSAKSTIAKLSDVNIPYYIEQESMNTANITSQVPAIYTLEYLAKEVKNFFNENPKA